MGQSICNKEILILGVKTLLRKHFVLMLIMERKYYGS